METIEQRFHAKYRVDAATGCWLWTASVRPSGYSQFRYSKAKNGYGHLFAYEHFVGPIPADRLLHHTCRNKSCVNPQHLELVTPRIHVLERDDTPAGRNARKTHCKNGHPLSGDNLYVNPTTGRRTCRTCQQQWRDDHQETLRAYQREYHAKRYREDPVFADRHRKASREAMRKWRAEGP